MSKLNVTAIGHCQGSFLNAGHAPTFFSMISIAGAPDRGPHDAAGAFAPS